MFFFCKQKTAYEMRISDWSSDVCSSDLTLITAPAATTVTTAKARKTSSVKSTRSSAEGGVGGAALGDLGFEPVPDCQQLLLVDDVLEIGRASCRERVCQYV